MFRPALELAGLDERLRPHDLRHTAASLMISGGASVKVVQRQLGHASAAMTLDIYAGLFADDLDELADHLDELRSSVQTKLLRPTAGPTDIPHLRAADDEAKNAQ